MLNHRVRTEDTEDDETATKYGESQVTLVTDIYGFKKLLFIDDVPQIKTRVTNKINADLNQQKLSPNLGVLQRCSC